MRKTFLSMAVILAFSTGNVLAADKDLKEDFSEMRMNDFSSQASLAKVSQGQNAMHDESEKTSSLTVKQNVGKDTRVEHNLDDTIITAQRRRNSDLFTPATTQVLTAKEMEQAGYRNVYEAIDQQIGSTSTAYGEAGQDFGFSAGRITLRGYDRGTLILVNGIPMNLKNYASTENIPMEMVDRIEIVKGASSTLYGSQAVGGVINILLKKPIPEKSQTKAMITGGNRFKKSEVFIQGNHFLFDVSKDWTKDFVHSNAFGPDKVSSIDWKVGKGKREHMALAVGISDALSFYYNYTKGDITRTGTRYNTKTMTPLPSTPKSLNPMAYRYDDYRQMAGLLYEDKRHNIHGVLGYNYRKVDGFDLAAGKKLSSNRTLDNEILDLQKQWHLDKDSLILGYSYKREAAKILAGETKPVRTSNALYVSYDKHLNPRWDLTFGLRGEGIHDPVKNQSVFMPQFQTDYKINADTAWYINIGRAFQMLPVDSMYDAMGNNPKGKANGNALLPESGWVYEIGVKHRKGRNHWSADVYFMNIENKMGWKKDPVDPSSYVVINEGDFRNLGFETAWERQLTAAWHLNLGLSISNPEVRDPSVRNPKWTQDSARLEGLIALDYQKEKWTGNLNFKYLGDRENYMAHDIPAKLALNLNFIYAAGKNDSFTLGIYNALDRDNYLIKYGSLDLPRNFRLTYEHTF